MEDRIDEGWTDEQILDYLEDRFAGIRLDPRFSGTTVLLWMLPLGMAAAGIILADRRLMRPRDPPGA